MTTGSDFMRHKIYTARFLISRWDLWDLSQHCFDSLEHRRLSHLGKHYSKGKKQLRQEGSHHPSQLSEIVPIPSWFHHHQIYLISAELYPDFNPRPCYFFSPKFVYTAAPNSIVHNCCPTNIAISGVYAIFRQTPISICRLYSFPLYPEIYFRTFFNNSKHHRFPRNIFTSPHSNLFSDLFQHRFQWIGFVGKIETGNHRFSH